MPRDERLTMSVFFRGEKKASGELTVKDTSAYSTYQLKYIRQYPYADNLSNFQDTGQGFSYTLQLTPDIYRDNTKLYYEVSGNDGNKIKFYGDTDSMSSGYDVNRGTATVNQNSKSATIRIVNEFFPSASGYGATLNIWHDESKTVQLASIPIRNSGLNISNVEFLTDRFINGKTSSKLIYAGDNVYIRGKISGNYLVTFYPAKLYIDGQTASSSSNPYVSQAYIESVNTNFNDANFTFSSNIFTKHKSGSGAVNLNYKMGDIDISAQLLPGLGESVIKSTSRSFGGSVGSTDTTIENFIANQGNPSFLLGGTYRGAIVDGIVKLNVNGSNLNVRMQTNGGGNISLFGYDINFLNSANIVQRQQFGRFQKAFRLDSTNADLNITKDMLFDQVANDNYGATPNLNSNQLVVLHTPEHDYSHQRTMMYENNAIIKDKWGDSKVNVLVLRAFDTPDPYIGQVPYPRIIKAGFTGIGSTVIVSGSGYDARDDKYALIVNLVGLNDSDDAQYNGRTLFVTRRDGDGWWINQGPRSTMLQYAVVQLYA